MQTIVRQWQVWVIALAAASVSIARADDAQTPGMDAYAKVQAMRQEANALIDANASAQDIHKAIGIFDDALRVLEQPQNEEIGSGNIYLRFRRYDIELDLAQAYAELGDKQKAIDHLEAATQVSSLVDITDVLLKYRPGLQGLQAEPRFQRLVAQTAAVERLWKHPDIATPYTETLSVEQRIAGLSLFWSEANYNFVYFDHVPDLDWDKTYIDFLAQVIAAKTTHDYYDVLMLLAPLLHDGHTNIYPPQELQNQFYARPPLRTELIEGRVIVREVWSPSLVSQGIHVGDEVLAIDGQPVRDYAEQHQRPYASSSTAQDAEVRIYTYGLFSGDAAKPVELTLGDAAGHKRTLSVSRGQYADAKRQKKPAVRDLGDGVIYVRVDQFENDATVKAFEQALPDILESKALILDVRDNGGGSTDYGLQILSYLSRQPIPTTVPRARDYRPVSRAQGAALLSWTTLDHADFSKPRDRIFEGPVAVLIGPRTFSAGEDFVASFDLMHRGLLVGTVTGGSTGQPLMFKLPGGGTARICVKRDAYPDGREFVGKGIAPTIRVVQTVSDVRADRDRALEIARVELLKQVNRQK